MQTESHATYGVLNKSYRGSDGTHTAHQLSKLVNRGEMLRLRRGIYLDTATWLQSAPWDRFVIMATATGLANPQAIFCRETALALHNVPLLHTPGAVQIRAHSNGHTGRQRQSPMTGRASQHTLRSKWRSIIDHSQHRGQTTLDFRGFDTARYQFPLSLRENTQGGLCPSMTSTYHSALAQVRVTPTEHFRPGNDILRTEPLALAVVDAASRMGFAEAVVVLDAVTSATSAYGRPLTEQDFEPWLQFLPSSRALHRWERAHSFADGRSESVGESLSRVRFEELGFVKPTLQHVIRLSDGTAYRPDFFWEEAGIIGEFDGRMKYSRAQKLSGRSASDVVVSEKLREDRLREQYKFVRWIWDDLNDAQRLYRLLIRSGVPRK